MIPVTKPFLPPLEEYTKKLEGIYARNWLTNDGPLVRELEAKLSERLGVKHLLYVSNGTIALQIAIKALGLRGKVITTPFSYVATSSSIIWEGCEPVYVDIEPDGFNIDASKIEEAITPEVSGIVATHCFGIPCDVEAIEVIAKRHNLKVIYDAAHAFGTTINGRSILEFGDVSACSFHATKIFHTIEGGSVSTSDPEIARRMALMRNFGHCGLEKFDGIGINGKNSEFHAAMGLVNLDYLDGIIAHRKLLCDWYNYYLESTDVKKPNINREGWNYSYYPLVFSSEQQCLKMRDKLESLQIQTRRYFFPSLNTLNDWSPAACEKAEYASSHSLCLPFGHHLEESDVQMIAKFIMS